MTRLHVENGKPNKMISILKEEKPVEQVLNDNLRNALMSMFTEGHQSKSFAREKMEKFLYECLTDLTPNAEANCIHSKSKELASFLYENMPNLFHDLNNNKHLIRYSQKAMQMYISL